MKTEKLNSICNDCLKLGNDCNGTTCQTWTGCVYRVVEKWVISPGNFTGYARTHLVNGKCPYTGRTEAEYLAEGCRVVSWEQFQRLVEDYEKSLCGNWKEITAEEWEDMLNVLPPVAWYNGGFYMSERYFGSVSGFYQRMDGKYYTSLQDMCTPRDQIIASLRIWIAEKEATQ